MLDDVLAMLLPGLLLGVFVGAVAQLTTFCSVGAVADIILAKDWRRARSWVMAAAIALLGTQIAAVERIVPLSHSAYRAPLANPLLALIGGVIFGYGMAQAGGCLQRALVRIGGGSMKSLITVAIMAGTGLMASAILSSSLWSATAWPVTIPSTWDDLAATALHLDPMTARIAVSSIIAASLFAFCLKDSWFRQSPGTVLGGIAIGVAVILAWVQESQHPRELAVGLNLFVDLLRVASFHGGSTAPSNGFLAVSAVLIGIILGSFIVAAIRRDLMLDRFVDWADIKRHVGGGALMGVGGAMAYGCTFGQGLSGFSTLSITSFIAIAAMIAGCVWGIRTLEAGSAWAGLRLCFGRR